jgi:hypothetical protein
LKSILKSLAFVMTVLGCGSAFAESYPNLGLNNDDNGKFSYIQMSDEYAMTAKHISTLKEHDYECSLGCDLVFFKHKNPKFENGIWRAPVIKEEVVQVGITQEGGVIIKTGEVTDEYTKPEKDSRFYNMSTTSKTVKGMSGGPVYSSDGKIIGMTIGSPQDKTEVKDVDSIFIPYEIIKLEWENFEKIHNLEPTKF